MSETFIQVSNLQKVYSMGDVAVKALGGVTLEIRRESFCLIMGPSGSGKSTLLYLLGGLDRPTGGEIFVGGRTLDSLDENQLAAYRRQLVGFIFQSFNLISSMTAWENVAYPMQFAGIRPKERRSRAFELLHRIGLDDRAMHRPTELSGGQQQRVAIARALVNSPQLILADEPTGNLDTSSGDSVLRLLGDLHQSGTTVVVVSHDARVANYASQVVHILDGCIHNGEFLEEAPADVVP